MEQKLSFKPLKIESSNDEDNIESDNESVGTVNTTITTFTNVTDNKSSFIRKNPLDFDTDINITKSKRGKKTLKGLINSRVKDDRRNYKRNKTTFGIDEKYVTTLTIDQVRDSVRKQLMLLFSIMMRMNTPYTLIENDKVILKNHYSEYIEFEKELQRTNDNIVTKPLAPFPFYLPKMLHNLNSKKWNNEIKDISNKFDNDLTKIVKWFYKISINIEKSIYNNAIKQFQMKYKFYKIMNRNYQYFEVRRIYARTWNMVKTNLINANGLKILKQLMVGDLEDREFIHTPHDKLFPELFDETKYKSSIIMYYINSDTMDSMIHCNKCKHNKLEYNRVVYYQLQTRSADEPMTTFCECLTCGAKFKF
jgi:hypothetical protein